MVRKSKAPPNRKKPNNKPGSSSLVQSLPAKRLPLKIKVIIHDAEEGGFWAEVPALPGCFTEGDTREELLANLREAIEGILIGAGPSTPLGQDAHAEEIEI